MMPEELPTDAPVEEQPVVTDEAAESTPAEEPEPFVLPDEFVQEVREWGGPEAVREARQLQQALQTEDGQIDLLVQLLRSVGYGVKEIEYMFSDQFRVPDAGLPAPGQVQQPGEPPEEKVITAADLDQKLAEVQSQYAQQLQAIELQRAQAVTTQVVDTFFGEKQVEDPQVRRLIINLGAQILPDGDFDPQHVRSALDQAFTMYQAQVEKEAKRYAQSKLATAKSQPTHVGGGTSGGEDDTPQYGQLGAKALEVAKRRVRERYKASLAEES